MNVPTPLAVPPVGEEGEVPRPRKPLPRRRLTALMFLGWFLVFLGLIGLFAAGKWLYSGPLDQFCQPTAGNLTCQYQYFPASVSILSPLTFVVLLLLAFVPPVAYFSLRWAYRALGVVVMSGVALMTMGIVYLPPKYLYTGFGRFGHPSVSAAGFFTSLAVAIGAMMVAYALIERPTVARKPKSRRRHLRNPHPDRAL